MGRGGKGKTWVKFYDGLAYLTLQAYSFRTRVWTQARIVTESRIIAKHNWATDTSGIAAADEDRGAVSTGYDTGGLTTQ